MTERALWRTVRTALAPYGSLVRIENKVELGTPDVLYCLRGVTGLLELKQINDCSSGRTSMRQWRREPDRFGGT